MLAMYQLRSGALLVMKGVARGVCEASFDGYLGVGEDFSSALDALLALLEQGYEQGYATTVAAFAEASALGPQHELRHKVSAFLRLVDGKRLA